MIINKYRKATLLLWLLGLIVLSPISTILSQKYLHLPLSLPELFAIPFIFMLREKFNGINVLRFFAKNIWVILFLCIIAIIAGYFPVYAILSNARGWLYLFAFYGLFQMYEVFDTDDMLYISFGALVGWLISAISDISAIAVGSVSDDVSITTTGLMLSIPIFVSLVLKKDNKWLLWIGIAVLLGIMVFSGIRRAIMIIALSFVLTLYLSLRKNPSKIFGYVILLLMLSLIFVIFLPIISEWVQDFSPMLYVRVFQRTELLLTEGLGASGDNIRTNNMKIFLNTFYEYLIPRGFVSLQTATDSRTGIFNDLPILQISWIFSLPVSIFIVSKNIRVLLINYRRFKRNNSTETMMCIVCSVVMLCLLFLEGTYLTFAFATPVTGAMLGWASRISKYRN